MPFDAAYSAPVDWEITLADRIAYWKKRIEDAPEPLQATIDYETRSPCDLKKHGAFLYSLDPRTEAMCLAYHLPGQTSVGLWHMAHDDFMIGESELPEDLFAFILAGGLVEAHNAFFERCIWTNISVARHGWPAVPPLQWRCSASRASAMSLPRDLEGACLAMDLGIEKDSEGRKLMLKMCKPRKPRKAEKAEWAERFGKDTPMPILYHETEEDIHRLWAYCKQDVFAEHALSKAIPELSPSELQVWLMDQWINWRGARFDLKMAHKALAMADKWKAKLNAILEGVTGISAGTKRQAVRDWLAEHEDLELPDTAADTLDYYLENEDLSKRAALVLKIVKDVNRTSARKYQAMIDKTYDDDERARDLMMYHGAGTGRWAGKGIQIHNFPARDLIVKDFDEAAELILEGDVDWCHALYDDVIKFLSHSLRGAIMAEEGRDFMVADYSAIEARVVLWLAAAESALDVFRRGEDIYCDMATGIYGFQVQKAIAKDWRHPQFTLHAGCRQFGKQAILGLGYNMGYLTFLLTCRKYGITFSVQDVIRIMGVEKFEKTNNWVRDQLCLNEPPADMSSEEHKRYNNKKRQASKNRRRLIEAREDPAAITHELALMKHTVDVFRSRYDAVASLWKEQEVAAIRAVREGGTIITTMRDKGTDLNTFRAPAIECGKVKWRLSEGYSVDDPLVGKILVPPGKWLFCELPSGRCIAYCDPRIKQGLTAWGEKRPGLRYMSVNGTTRKWENTSTYGGKIVENITQAVARDIMAEAMLNAHKNDTYDPIMSVHDELVCEVNEGEGSHEEFEEIMSSLPPWAAGCPIVAEADRFKRYRK